MKIVCDSCSAKYSIADEKVAGKVFKIRCKKCSNIIVVRGAEGEAAPAPAPSQYDEKETRVFDYAGQDEAGQDGAGQDGAGQDYAGQDGAGAEWHLVIDQEQIGPMTAEEVGQRFSAGEVDADTYIWKEGFADWLPIAEVDVFAGMVASAGMAGDGGAAAVAPVAAAGAIGAAAPAADDAMAGMFGGPAVEDGNTAQSDPADLFAAAAAGAGSMDDGGDLFGASSMGAGAAASPGAGSMADSLFGDDDDGDAEAGEPRLRGERNENSVLFSLNNLAALASPGAAASSSMSASSSPSSSAGASAQPGMAQAGGGEGSGLIDIRSMASAYLADKGGAVAGAAPDDDLPSFGATSFDAPAAVLLPTSVGSSSGNNKLIYTLFGVIAALLVAAVVIVVLILKGGDNKASVAAGDVTAGRDEPANSAGASNDKNTDSTDSTDNTDGAGDLDRTSGDSKDTTDKSGATGAEPGGDDSDSAAKDKPAAKDRPSSRKPSSRKPSSRKPSSRKPRSRKPSKPASKPKKPSSSKKCDEVSCLLSDNPPSCCSKYRGSSRKPSRGGGSKPAPNSNLPEKLARADIASGMAKVRGRVTSCGDKVPGKGTVKVKVKVGGNGRVSSVTVKSAPNNSLGGCVSKSVKRARFKKTQNGGSFTYPFIFR